MKRSLKVVTLLVVALMASPAFAQNLCGLLTEQWNIPPSMLGPGMANSKIFFMKEAHSEKFYSVQPADKTALSQMEKVANTDAPVCLAGKFWVNDSPEVGVLPGDHEVGFSATSVIGGF